jgi:hypothetical protein
MATARVLPVALGHDLETVQRSQKFAEGLWNSLNVRGLCRLGLLEIERVAMRSFFFVLEFSCTSRSTSTVSQSSAIRR